jgi:predicted regulator of Ras-like GTPase activity (Roadblock/LC7/MglB family)
MTSRLGVLLESAIQSPGVVAAVLARSDGCVIENASRVENDQARSGAVAGNMLRRWTVTGLDLGMGVLHSLLIEETSGPAMIAPVGSDAILLVVGNQTCRPGHLRLAAKHATGALGELARTGLEADANVVPQPAEHLDPPPPAIDEDSSAIPPASPTVTTGEVVLIGAHTFQLVTKLVTHLLKMRGVRSSRLRAYSPSSTIIDVVLEDGASLAAIDSQSLEEFSVERTEGQGTRLVLRADSAFAISHGPISTTS